MPPEVIIAGAGPISAAILVLAAGVCLIGATILVVVRRPIAWIGPVAAATTIALIALIRDQGGITTPREDAIAVVILCTIGALVGASPVAFASWVRRAFREEKRRLTAHQ